MELRVINAMNSRLLMSFWVAIACASPSSVLFADGDNAGGDSGLWNAISSGTPDFSLRWRYEHVEDDLHVTGRVEESLLLVCEIALKVLSQAGCRCVAPLRFLCHRLHHDPVEVAPQPAS